MSGLSAVVGSACVVRGSVVAAIGTTIEEDPGFLDCAHSNLPTSRRAIDPIVAQLAAASTRPPRVSATEVVVDEHHRQRRAGILAPGADLLG